jgi:hypothetical protein
MRRLGEKSLQEFSFLPGMSVNMALQMVREIKKKAFATYEHRLTFTVANIVLCWQ